MGEQPTPTPEIPGYGKVEPTKGFDKEGSLNPPDKSAFESHLNESIPLGKEETTASITPEELQSLQITQKPTQQSIFAQMDANQAELNKATENFTKLNQALLKRPEIPFKEQHKKILDNKLSQSFNHIQKAAKYLNANITSPAPSIQSGPLGKFINYLSDGQNQLIQARNQLKKIQSQKGMIQPSQMLGIQVNLARAQQEITFSSMLLNQVISGLKQIFNIQV